MHSHHFENKDPLTHVIEKKAEHVHSFSEVHGTELPGHLFAGADAAKETALIILLISIGLTLFSIPHFQIKILLIAFLCSWVIWKAGRSAWLGWTRLERVHRAVEQEKHEIEHNRAQEKEELTALYQAKGLEGKLLEDVISVLMSDQDRLLKIMLEEEFGISLHSYEHPLKQAFGATVGTLIAGGLTVAGYLVHPFYGTLIATLFVMGTAAGISARYAKNGLTSAVVWILSLCSLSFGVYYFVTKILWDIL